MSHLKERKEKICLNCGAAIYGRYCHVCGQENIEPKESFWHLVTHFVYDIIHFDGKFFSTLKYLLFWPGHLSHEYLKGRRTSYLHPIRMYVFTSAFFFLIYFSFYQGEIVKTKITGQSAATLVQVMKQEKNDIEVELKDTTVSEIVKAKKRERVEYLAHDIGMLERDSINIGALKSINRTFHFVFMGKKIGQQKNTESYDSVQKSLPKHQRDGIIIRAVEKQFHHLQKENNGDNISILSSILKDFRHRFPQTLFISLPLFALLLQLLYRRKKEFFYVNHVVFTIHLYCATFIIILVTLWMGSVFHWFHASIPNWLKLSVALLAFFYWYKALRNFYEQRRGKTILKYMLLMFMFLFVMVFLLVIFFIISALSI